MTPSPRAASTVAGIYLVGLLILLFAPETKGKPLPPDLKQKIARNQTALTERQAAIDEKKKEAEETKAKFEGYRKRLEELKAKNKADNKS